MGFEPMASSLPRTCSTTELQQQLQDNKKLTPYIFFAVSVFQASKSRIITLKR